MTNVAALTLGSKGLQTTALASGEMLIHGYLTRWSEIDRESEAFVRGSFAKSIPEFLRASAPLCVNHRLGDVVGKVLSLAEDSVGVRLVAKVFHQPETSHLRWAYNALKGGAMKGLSVGAIFEKIGSSIIGADIIECSITSTPVLATAGLEIISEGKALAFFGARPSDLDDVRHDLALARLRVANERLTLALARR